MMPALAITKASIKADPGQALIDLAANCSRDPLKFVLAAFPWSEPGELADFDGPDDWQRDILTSIRDGLRTIDQAIQIAIASGHGPGKSALVAWLILWAVTTVPDTRGVVTANTETQLRTKTWAELSRWHRLCLWAEWFALTATAIFSTIAGHDKTWRIDAVAWSERNTEAFAGLHNQGKRILVCFDEASAIPDIIWETTEGALTDTNTQIVWLAAGNPTRNTGRFRECFGRFRHRWLCRQIDSRTAKLTNKAQIAQWIADYGEDSDFVRVRVRGVFPRAGSMQFIGADLVEEAKAREPTVSLADPFVIGVDVARFGDDQTVICFRKGRDARTHPPVKLRNADNMVVAGRVAEEYQRFRADGVFVDGGGLGAGVVDRLRQMRVPVIDVQFGGKADRYQIGTGADHASYANKRAEMWGNMRDWLKGGAILDDPELAADLTGVEYGYNVRNEIQLERKEDMKKRGLASPDYGDALALTFAYPVMPSLQAGGAHAPASNVTSEYDPLGDA